VRFSKREKQVLELLAGGKTNKEIGTQLFIAESTVKFHVHAILSKLDAANRTEAVSIAVQQGIIQLTASE
jgi:DNA-binding NarL/FixJ family response regulator